MRCVNIATDPPAPPSTSSANSRSGDRLNMSSPERVRLLRMNDTTNEEKEYYKRNRLWRDVDYGPGPATVYKWRIFLLIPGILSLLGLAVLIVGVWALVQGTSYFSIAMLPTTVIIVSALLVLMGVVMVLVGIAYTLVLLLIARTNFSEFSDDWHNR